MLKKGFISRNRRFVIIAVHLLPLPGSPRWGGNFKRVIRSALDDARASADGGADAVIVKTLVTSLSTNPMCPPKRLQRWP